MSKSRTRDLSKEAAWRGRLDRQADSGQSVRAWCRKHRVTETAFYWWRKELARRDAEGRAASFVPVRVTAEPARDGDQRGRDQHDGDAPIEIVLMDGRRVRVTGSVNGQALADVLDVLERRTC